MSAKLTLASLACVFLVGVALSLAIYILVGVPVIQAVASPAPSSQSVEVPLCTDAIADAGGICQGVPEWERDGYEVVAPIPSPIQILDEGQPFLAHEIPSPEQVEPLVPRDEVVCHEDMPCWDCRFDGNEQCGVEIEGVWYVVQFRDGSPEGVTYR